MDQKHVAIEAIARLLAAAEEGDEAFEVFDPMLRDQYRDKARKFMVDLHLEVVVPVPVAEVSKEAALAADLTDHIIRNLDAAGMKFEREWRSMSQNGRDYARTLMETVVMRTLESRGVAQGFLSKEKEIVLNVLYCLTDNVGHLGEMWEDLDEEAQDAALDAWEYAVSERLEREASESQPRAS